MLIRIAAALPAWLRAWVARFPWLPFSVAALYLGDREPRVRFTALEYQKFDEDQIEVLCDSYLQVQLTIAYSDRIGMERVERFLESDASGLRKTAATNPLLSSEKLRELAAGTDDFYTKMGIAQNPNTPLDVLAKFLKDEDTMLVSDTNFMLNLMEEDDFLSKLKELGVEEWAEYPRAWVLKALA